MVKFGVVSDSHGAKIRTEMFAEVVRREKYDFIVFLGDGLSDMRALSKLVDCEIRTVAGNCDFAIGVDRELQFTVEGVRFVALHGDKYSVKYDLTGLSYHAESVNAQVALFGHTHRPTCEWLGNAILVNPGALKDGKYAEVVVDKNDVRPTLRSL